MRPDKHGCILAKWFLPKTFQRCVRRVGAALRSLVGDDEMVAFHLADAYRSSGMIRQAIDAYEMAEWLARANGNSGFALLCQSRRALTYSDAGERSAAAAAFAELSDARPKAQLNDPPRDRPKAGRSS